MNEQNKYARRYHWKQELVADFVNGPQAAIGGDSRGVTLNLVARTSAANRSVATEIAREQPEKILKELRKIQPLVLPARHPVLAQDIHPERLENIFLTTCENQPENFEQLLGMPGVGLKAVRDLSLVAALVYGVKPSFPDPADYSFAHSGKDGFPYPVDRSNYDRTIEFLQPAIRRAKIGRTEQLQAFQRLAQFYKSA